MAERLNWGCGPVVVEGWVNSDERFNPGMRLDWDWSHIANPPRAGGGDHVGRIQYGLPWADETFDYVVTHHALQMLPEVDLVPALAELRRVTSPGGYLRVSVPDMPTAIEAWASSDQGWFPLVAPSVDDALCVYLTQGGATRSLFTAGRLCRLLLAAGWWMATPREPGRTGCPDLGILGLDSRPHESIYVEAQR